MTPGLRIYGTFREELSSALRQAIEALEGAPASGWPAAIPWGKPPSASQGDYATTVAFDLARTLRRPPRKIAEEIQKRIALPRAFREARVEGGGYLNFFLDRGAAVAAFFSVPEAGAAAPGAPPRGKIIVEHTNINPNKAAHIGHLRNAILGDTLVRCLRALGHEVEVQNYIDDTGVQVADVVVGFLDVDGATLPEIEERIRTPRRGGRAYACFGDLCWDLYAEMGRIYEERPETKGLRAETLHAIEEGGNLRAAVAERIASAIVREHVATMGRVGVAYDLLAHESDILKKHFWTRAFEMLRERRVVELAPEGAHTGCWVMRLSDAEAFAGMDEPDKILVRSNGTVTYTGKDIAYQLWKLGRLGLDFDYAPFSPDWSAGRGGAEAVASEIRAHVVWQTRSGAGVPAHPRFGGGAVVYNVIDARQSYPQKVVREGIRLLGFPEEAESSRHFAYEMVALTPKTARRLAQLQGEAPPPPAEEEKGVVEMSGRKGQGVKAHDLMETLVAEALAQIRERNPDLDEASARARARDIAVGAARYFMLKFGRNSLIAFDFDEALSFEGDSGPYLQYSAVRADNIFRKLADAGLPHREEDLDASRLRAAAWEDDLWELVLEALRVEEGLEAAVRSEEPATLARLAYSLAQSFSRFYHRFPILTESDPAEREKRLAAVIVFRRGIERLFSLLGIPAPEKM